MEGDSCLGNTAPFYSASLDTPLPIPDHIKRNGICCAGVMNLARRYINQLEIYGIKEEDPRAGGLYLWEIELQERNVLRTLTLDTTLLPGTLLFLPYTSPVDQGHVAIVYDSKHILHSYCYTAEPERGQFTPGMVLEEYPHSIFSFTHYILPEDWLGQTETLLTV